MLAKIFVCIAGLATFKFFSAKSTDGCEDKAWVESFLIIMTGYYLVTGVSYILVYPFGDLFSEVPVKTAFFLTRFFTAIIALASLHLYYGVQLEMNV